MPLNREGGTTGKRRCSLRGRQEEEEPCAAAGHPKPIPGTVSTNFSEWTTTLRWRGTGKTPVVLPRHCRPCLGGDAAPLYGWGVGTGLSAHRPLGSHDYVGRRRRSRPPVTELHTVRVRNPRTLLPEDLPRPAAVVYASCLRAGPSGIRVLDLAVDAGMPLAKVAVLVALLRDAALVVDTPPPCVDRHLLERVLEGLHRL